MYQTGKSLYDYFTEESRNTSKAVQDDFGNSIDQCIFLTNAQFSILEQASWTFTLGQFSGRDATEPALLSALHKGTFLFYSAIDLTKRGFYGPAGTLLRSIYESLVIAKYSTVSSSREVFESWIEGNHVHLTNHIFNRIKHPDLQELRYLWKSLHQTAHATVFAQQLYLEYPQIKRDVEINLSLIQLLLCMNQHLLGTHFLTSPTIRYTRLYGDPASFEKARQEARDLVRNIRCSFTKSGKRAFREYSASWKVKK